MDIEDEYGVPTGVFGWVRRKTRVHFNNCCELAETLGEVLVQAAMVAA